MLTDDQVAVGAESLEFFMTGLTLLGGDAPPA